MKNHIKDAYLVGKKVYLRPLNKKDINERYLSWLNDAEVTKWSMAGVFPTTRKDLEDFYKRKCASKTDIIFAIVAKGTGKHIGNIKLGDINWIHRFADLGIMIGERKYWGKGYGREACSLLLEYAFNRLNLNKIILGVYATHIPAIKAYKGAGFRSEGRLKKMLSLHDRYVDRVIMGVLKKDFSKHVANYEKG